MSEAYGGVFWGSDLRILTIGLPEVVIVLPNGQYQVQVRHLRKACMLALKLVRSLS